MQHLLGLRHASLHRTISSRPSVVLHLKPVTATRPAQLKLASSSTLWPSQQQHLNHKISLSSHRGVAASQADLTSSPPVPPATYDFAPHVDSTVLAGQLLVLAITLGAAAYWWWSVVPSARRTLAKEKRSGALKEYLVELQQNPNKGVERWFYTDWLQQLQRRQQLAAQAAAKRAAAAAGTSNAATASAASASSSTVVAQPAGEQQAASESGSAADGVTAEAAQQQQQQKQQLPPPEESHADKEPNFWSLDNPLLATAVLLTALGVVSTLLHGGP